MGSVAKHIATPTDSDSVVESSKLLSSHTTEFHCTGFSKFYNVPVNPSELIMHHLQAALFEEPLPSNSILATTTVIPTDARAADRILNNLYNRHQGHSSPSSRTQVAIDNRRRVFIHCGVDVKSLRFRLELQGINEATFSCPDESGWRPRKLRIESDHDLTQIRSTDLPIYDLVTRLQRRGFETEVSHDAGRYVCNWVYYNSLKIAESAGDCTVLFVHVPDLKTAQLSHQVAFLTALLHEIAHLPLRPQQPILENIQPSISIVQSAIS